MQGAPEHRHGAIEQFFLQPSSSMNVNQRDHSKGFVHHHVGHVNAVYTRTSRLATARQSSTLAEPSVGERSFIDSDLRIEKKRWGPSAQVHQLRVIFGGSMPGNPPVDGSPPGVRSVMRAAGQHPVRQLKTKRGLKRTRTDGASHPPATSERH